MSIYQTDISQPLTAEELRSVFADHGLRMTRQRDVVYRVLRGCDSHPSADELMALVRLVDPDVSQATIYNTLDALVGCGLATRMPSPTSGGACMYDANFGEHVHLMLDTGQVIDVPMDLSQQILDSVPVSILEELSDRTGIEISGIKVELMGQRVSSMQCDK